MTDWIAKARGLALPGGLFVGGEERAAAGSATRAVHTPRDGSVLTELAWAGERDADDAVASARRAFDYGPWPRTPARERGEVLAQIGRAHV